MADLGEHTEAVEAAKERMERLGPRPLEELPSGFAASRVALHRVAEQVLMPKRRLETGNEIALCYAPGGFGAIPWERGEQSDCSGEIRVEGTEVVVVEDGEEQRVPVTDPHAAGEAAGVADHVGVEAGQSVKEEAASALADWFAFGTVVLARLIERHPDATPEPIRLWPEHFDVATELGSEEGGSRANFGASPGDSDHDLPYLYVGPWEAREGELWQATGFGGAELTYDEILSATDHVSKGIEFLEVRFAALADSA